MDRTNMNDQGALRHCQYKLSEALVDQGHSIVTLIWAAMRCAPGPMLKKLCESFPDLEEELLARVNSPWDGVLPRDLNEQGWRGKEQVVSLSARRREKNGDRTARRRSHATPATDPHGTEGGDV